MESAGFDACHFSSLCLAPAVKQEQGRLNGKVKITVTTATFPRWLTPAVGLSVKQGQAGKILIHHREGARVLGADKGDGELR